MNLWIINQEGAKPAHEHLRAYGANVYISLADWVPVAGEELEVLDAFDDTRFYSINYFHLIWGE